MRGMFYRSEFNGDISCWDVSNVWSMRYMFALSKFNGDISRWDVSSVKDMTCMFYKSNFNQDISGWNIRKLFSDKDMFGLCPIKEEYKPVKFRNM